jgi:triosephosphate isomerase
MRRRIVAGNWKMNGTISETEELLAGLLAGESKKEGTTVVVCPPFTSLQTAGKLLRDSHVGLGGQDMSEHEKGAYTGDISASMLLTVGASYVILGHSERRQHHGETDQRVNAKAKRALAAGLTPIICVGETESERDADETATIVGAQIDRCLDGLSGSDLRKIVVAYEPVWAIGTGKTATPEQAQEVHAFIRNRIGEIDRDAAGQLPILYGGSVKPNNAEELMAQPDIDGSLVGGASLKADDFIAIIQAS